MKKLALALLSLLMIVVLCSYFGETEGMAEGSGKYDYLITGSCNGFGAADTWIPESSLTVSVDSEEALNKFGLEVVVNGSDPLAVVLASDYEGLYFSLPDLVDGCWFISFEDLMEILNPYLEDAGMSSDGAVNALFEVISADELKEHVVRYRDILLSVSNAQNTARRFGSYELEGLGEKQFAMKLTCRPEHDDWTNMLKELFTTARNDEKLLDVMVKVLEISAANGSQQAMLEQYGFNSFEDFKPAIQEKLDQAIANVDQIADALTGLELEAASSTKRIYAVKLTLPDGTAFGYESYGKPEVQRKDAIVLYGEQPAVLALNSYQRTDSGVNGELRILVPTEITLSYVTNRKDDDSLDLDVRAEVAKITATLKAFGAKDSRQLNFRCNLGDQEFEILAQKFLREEKLMIDTENRRVLRTEEEVKEAANEIMTAFGNTDFIAKIGEITG